jgi:hypothetical protein
VVLFEGRTEGGEKGWGGVVSGSSLLNGVAGDREGGGGSDNVPRLSGGAIPRGQGAWEANRWAMATMLGGCAG